MPTEWISTTTSWGPGSGMGCSSMRKSPIPCRTAARFVCAGIPRACPAGGWSATKLRRKARPATFRWYACFMRAPLPDNETDRLAPLYALDVLHSEPEKDFDDIVALASAVCGVPMSLVSLIDTDRQWLKGRGGRDLGA